MKDEEIEKKHRKKMVAPIVISIMIVIYCCFYVVMCFIMPVPLVMKILFGVIPLAFIGVVVYVLVERMNEIRSGEEDDLSKY
jgi:archaellum biogenesis protein FlaJ (TadC family)